MQHLPGRVAELGLNTIERRGYTLEDRPVPTKDGWNSRDFRGEGEREREMCVCKDRERERERGQAANTA